LRFHIYFRHVAAAVLITLLRLIIFAIFRERAMPAAATRYTLLRHARHFAIFAMPRLMLPLSLPFTPDADAVPPLMRDADYFHYQTFSILRHAPCHF
jgi:hypothetical protein